MLKVEKGKWWEGAVMKGCVLGRQCEAFSGVETAAPLGKWACSEAAHQGRISAGPFASILSALGVAQQTE